MIRAAQQSINMDGMLDAGVRPSAAAPANEFHKLDEKMKKILQQKNPIPGPHHPTYLTMIKVSSCASLAVPSCHTLSVFAISQQALEMARRSQTASGLWTLMATARDCALTGRASRPDLLCHERMES